MSPVGHRKGDPSLYIDIESHQEEIRRTGSPILWVLAEALRRPGITPIERNVAVDFFDRISDEVLWAATEVYPADDWKLLSQRYISFEVRRRFSDALAAGANSIKSLTRDRSNRDRVAVKHEHVVPRESLKRAILKGASEKDVHNLVERSLACVVTCAENELLPVNGIGWERYIGRVRVFDRKRQTEIDLEHEWEQQQAAWNVPA